MSRYPERPLGEAIRLDIDEVPVSVGSIFELAGVYSFGRGLFSRGKIYGDQTSYAKLNRLHEGQVVLSRLKAFEGAISLVDKEFDQFVLSPEFPTFSAMAKTDIRYEGFLCQWPDLWKSLNRSSKGLGARRERVSSKHLLEIRMPLPDYSEQKRVAEKLDGLLRRVDAVRELRARSSSLRAAFTESLIEKTVNCAREAVRVCQVLALQRTPVVIDPEATYQTIGVRSFGKGFIHHSPDTGENLSKLNYFQFPAGALALSNLMAWEGGIAVTCPDDTRYVASNRFFFYLPIDDRVNVSYLRHFFVSRLGQTLIASACSAGAERNRTLGRGRFEALEIPLPSRAEQDRVARILDSLAERMNEVHSNPALGSLRPAILNAAFTGQL